MIDLSKTAASSKYAGLGNYYEEDFNFNIPATTIADDTQVLFTREIDIERSDAIVNMRAYVNGLDEPAWFHVSGGVLYGFPNLPSGSFPNFYCQIRHTREANKVIIYAIYRNPRWPVVGSRNLPAHTINIKARLFVAPFK